ncbi:hypothetical protein [Pseudomonas sp. GWSMS-1]|uniref:hypothetical protein n=1 Tax=Pseudomonas sp. GWSMS-1 TaxID=3308997 RepID=UPI003CE78BAE
MRDLLGMQTGIQKRQWPEYGPACGAAYAGCFTWFYQAPAIEAAFARFGSAHKQLIALTDTQDPSHHVLAGDILSPNDTPRVQAAILAFLASLPAKP